MQNATIDNMKATRRSAPKAPATPRRVMVVDDHALMRHGLSDMINHEPDLEVCGEAEDAATALHLVESARPDLITIDISLKEGNGLELVKQIKASYPEVRTIVLTMHDEKLYAERVLNAGAMGFVSKQDPAGTIIKAIRRVLGDKVYLSDRMAERVLHRLVSGEDEVENPGVDSLSDRELQVFEMMGQGLASRDIATKLHLSTKTVDTYRQRVKEKLNLANGNEVVRYAMQWAIDHT